ncbi:hypothetical protein IMY05_010G0196700 [Salix suchowensis]|nr:hypothetical protein IMY05_010G0196700 [Salix suchowensis]
MTTLMKIKKIKIKQRNIQKNEETANIADDKETTEGLEDQVKIIPLPSSQAIRDLAERPLAGNRRNWFDQCFPVPENRDVNKMQYDFSTQPNSREGMEEIKPKDTSTAEKEEVMNEE